MENLYEKWETLSPVEKFKYAEEYWDAVESPNKWYAMSDFDNQFADYSPLKLHANLQRESLIHTTVSLNMTTTEML